jgi:hypothetical protein
MVLFLSLELHPILKTLCQKSHAPDAPRQTDSSVKRPCGSRMVAQIAEGLRQT